MTHAVQHRVFHAIKIMSRNIPFNIFSKYNDKFFISFIQSGYGSRRGSQMATYPIDEGYVPEYHTGRRYSTQDQVIM